MPNGNQVDASQLEKVKSTGSSSGRRNEKNDKGKPKRAREYCPNPYGKKHPKLARNKTFVVVSEATVAATRGQIENLRAGDHICKSCHLRIFTFIRSLPLVEEVAPALKELECSDERFTQSEEDISTTSTDSNFSDEDFLDSATEKNNLVSLLQSMNIAAPEIQQRYVSTSAASSTYERVKSRVHEIKLNLQKITGSKKGLSPRKENEPIKDRECKKCQNLLDAFAERFKSVASKEDQYHILTSLPVGTTIASMIQKFGCTTYMARTASHLRKTVGIFSCPSRKRRQGLDPQTVKKVLNFFESDENSRVDPCQRRAVYVKNPQTGARELQAKRVIWMTLNEFYREFKLKHPEAKISVSALSLLRPKNIIWSGRNGFHNSCTCSIHENFNLPLRSLDVEEGLNDFLSKIYCSLENDACMFGICQNCPKLEVIDAYIGEIDAERISYNYWGTTPGCIGLQLLDATEDRDEFRDRVRHAIPAFSSHHFIAKKQKEFVTWLKEDLVMDARSAVLQVDFAQNYAFIIQNAVAGHHWSNCQATVVPFVLTWYCKTDQKIHKKAYVVISDELAHNASTFHAFYIAVIQQIEEDSLKFETIHIVSDGAGSQFKNWKTLLNLRYHVIQFGMKAVWHFFATSHGKSECDVAGATVKRACRLASLKLDISTRSQINLRNSVEMASYAAAKLNSSSMKIMHISANSVKMSLDSCNIEARYSTGEKIPGIRMYHSFDPESAKKITARRYSSATVKKCFTFLGSASENQQKYSTGQYVATQINHRYAVGKIISENLDADEFEIQLLQQVGETNNFNWPQIVNIQCFPVDEILCVLDHPKSVGSKEDSLQVSVTEFRQIKSLLMHLLV